MPKSPADLIALLRSGKYPKGKGNLIGSFKDGKTGFCCLGVAGFSTLEPMCPDIAWSLMENVPMPLDLPEEYADIIHAEWPWLLDRDPHNPNGYLSVEDRLSIYNDESASWEERVIPYLEELQESYDATRA
jgi:hypothetical protein